MSDWFLIIPGTACFQLCCHGNEGKTLTTGGETGDEVRSLSDYYPVS